MLTGEADGLKTMMALLGQTDGRLAGILGRQESSAADSPLLAARAQIVAFRNEAIPLFEAATSKNSAAPDFQKRAAAFQKIVAEVRSLLTTISENESRDLHGALMELQRDTRRQRHAGLILFAAVIVGGAALGSYLVRRTIVRPVLDCAGKLVDEAGYISNASEEFAEASQALAKGSQPT